MTPTNQKLSTEPYRGTRDFYPEDMSLQNYIFSTMKTVVERYGYIEYTASLLEETAMYRAKSGSEIVNQQTYSFIDRGGRDVTIRPEMTPTVARMIARKRKELPLPLRWFSIPNLFRYERPQRGRLREHWQLNVDIFGINSLEADAEIISVAYDIMKSFGARDENFNIRINSRKLINYLFNEYFTLSEENSYQLIKLIDHKNKMESKEFILQVESILCEKSHEFMDFLTCTDITQLPDSFAQYEGAQDLKNIFDILSKKGILNCVFDPSLMRGFDYYTGTVFEVFDTNPVNSRSLFGGGRYDDLVAIFDAEKVPGVGFGMGDVTIHNYIDTYNLLPQYKSTTKLYICILDNEYISLANELSSHLRANKVNVAVDYSNRKLSSQIKTAEKQKIPFIVCIGQDESQTKIFKIKDIEKRTEKIVHWNELAKVLMEC